jgi:hypothetical protein
MYAALTFSNSKFLCSAYIFQLLSFSAVPTSFKFKFLCNAYILRILSFYAALTFLKYKLI